jgi:putative ABC transport system permease protein
MQNFVYAFRTLRRTPGFTVVAILLLALGIGANSAAFSVVYAVLLRPLPYPQPQQLVQLVRNGDAGDSVSGPEYTFTRDRATAFSSVAAYLTGRERLVKVGSEYETASTVFFSTNTLRTLGVAPAFGREFVADETRPNGPRSAILSAPLAARVFGGESNAVGRRVTLDDVAYNVVGVLPRGFWFPSTPDVLLPFAFAGDNGANSTLIARLKADVSIEQSASQLGTFTAGLKQANPLGLPEKYSGLRPVSFHERVSGGVRSNLLMLFAAVGLLLLIACSNLASLLLARLAARQKEIAVRLALGSGASRLFAQYLVENIVLASAGGAAGLLVGVWLLEGLLALIPLELPSSVPISLNLGALGLTFAAAVTATMAGSLLPLWAATRMNVGGALQVGSRSIQGGPKQRVRNVLVVAQVAASVTLLVSATLLIQSLYKLRQESLGFEANGLVTFSTPVAPERRGKQAEIQRFNTELLERLRTLPGVRGAAAVNLLPLAGQNNFPTQREGHPEQSIGPMEIRQVTPEYFATMGIRLIRGRMFNANDDATGAPTVIISENLAKAWWDKGNPVGDRVRIGMFQGRALGEDRARGIVGVVADTKTRNLKEPARTTIYIPAPQWETGAMSWVVRGDVSAEQLGAAVRELDPRQRVERVRTMSAIVAASSVNSRFDAWLFGGLALLALILTAVGICGLLAYSVARRTHEIGTRMALGATPNDVLKLVLRQGGGLILAGLAIGTLAARSATEFISNLLFGTRVTDWSSYGITAAVLLLTGLLASYLPARRAANVDPLVALRREE